MKEKITLPKEIVSNPIFKDILKIFEKSGTYKKIDKIYLTFIRYFKALNAKDKWLIDYLCKKLCTLDSESNLIEKAIAFAWFDEYIRLLDKKNYV